MEFKDWLDFINEVKWPVTLIAAVIIIKLELRKRKK